MSSLVVNPQGAPRRGLKIAVGLGASALGLWALFSTVKVEALQAALSRARPEPLALALLAIALAYLLKVERLAGMLRGLGAQPRFQDAATALLGCVALNNLLPLRAGDVVRVTAFQRFTRTQPATQLGAIALERLLDIAALMALMFVASTLAPDTALPEEATAAVKLATLAAMGGVIGATTAPGLIRSLARFMEETRYARLVKPAAALRGLADAVQALAKPAVLLRAAGVSLAAWLAEGGAFLAVAVALGLPLGAPGALLALAFATLATMVPSSPGYVGTFHVAAALTAKAFGADAAQAAAFAVLIHGLLWLSTTAAGLLLLAVAGFGRRRGAVVQGPDQKGDAS
jgi:hypothetical protein